MRKPGGLWRHRDFLSLWGAETISQFGSQVSLLALPQLEGATVSERQDACGHRGGRAVALLSVPVV